jgi:hypothetical protein
VIEKELEKAATAIINSAERHVEAELKRLARKVKKWQPGKMLKRWFKF